MTPGSVLLIALAGGMLLLVGAITHFSGNGSLDNIKSKTVGDGQHGTARWATKQEVRKTYRPIPFRPKEWRQGKDLPKIQGLVLGCIGRPVLERKPITVLKRFQIGPLPELPVPEFWRKRTELKALVDGDDIHCLMIGASGVGKTAFYLYPNMEYACASGMSYLALDTKGGATRCETRGALQAL